MGISFSRLAKRR